MGRREPLLFLLVQKERVEMLDEIHSLIADLVKGFSFAVNDYAGGVTVCWFRFLHNNRYLVIKWEQFIEDNNMLSLIQIKIFMKAVYGATCVP